MLGVKKPPDAPDPLTWDDLRYVLAVARAGSLLRAGAVLGVDHTTVGRRVAAAEAALGETLFVRSSGGLTPTPAGEQLLAPIEQVEEAVLAVERRAGSGGLVGRVKITAPESLGIAWLAPRLAAFGARHPGLHVVLDPSGAVLDLTRREAEVAVRTFRTSDAALVVRKAGTYRYGLYASKALLARHPIREPEDLARCPLLVGAEGDPETAWLTGLAKGASAPPFSCVLAVALLAACRSGAGAAALPRYLGESDPDLVYLPMPDEPTESVYLTVHRDLRTTPRVRAVLDFLLGELRGLE